MFYSKTTGGFYNNDINGENIPADAVEITDELHKSLMDGQGTEGKIIVFDEISQLPALATPDPPPVIPSSITQRQARISMLDAGILDDVEAAISSIAGVEGEKARIAWEWASEIRRDDPLLISIAEHLGLDSEQIDQIFLEASKI